MYLKFLLCLVAIIFAWHQYLNSNDLKKEEIAADIPKNQIEPVIIDAVEYVFYIIPEKIDEFKANLAHYKNREDLEE